MHLFRPQQKKYYEALRFICPFPAVVNGAYNPEIQIYRGYWMISWFKKEFAQKRSQSSKRVKHITRRVIEQTP